MTPEEAEAKAKAALIEAANKVEEEEDTSSNVAPPSEVNTHSDLLEDIAKDLAKDLKTKYGDMDLSHLDIETRVKTMRSMLKAKIPEPKKKPEVADTDGEPAVVEWKPQASFVEMAEQANKLKVFYNKKKAMGQELWDEIYGK